MTTQKEKTPRLSQNVLVFLKEEETYWFFGEGFTDETFVRRLKTSQKGAAKIGFQTLVSMDWKEKVYMAGIGINYTYPNMMRSDLLIATSDKICLNDYKDAYLESPAKTIREITKLVEVKMQSCLTHVQDYDLTELHENLIALSQKGMHATSFDKRMSLIERSKYSQSLAIEINNSSKDKASLLQLNERINAFLKNVKANKFYLQIWKRDKFNHPIIGYK